MGLCTVIHVPENTSRTCYDKNGIVLRERKKSENYIQIRIYSRGEMGRNTETETKRKDR